MIKGYSLAGGCAVRVNIQHPVSGNAAIDLYGKKNLWHDVTCTLVDIRNLPTTALGVVSLSPRQMEARSFCFHPRTWTTSAWSLVTPGADRSESRQGASGIGPLQHR
jgi:hypothetical protein